MFERGIRTDKQAHEYPLMHSFVYVVFSMRNKSALFYWTPVLPYNEILSSRSNIRFLRFLSQVAILKWHKKVIVILSKEK